MDSEKRILEKGAVAVENEKIVAVDETKNLESDMKPEKVVDASGRIIMPGLICSHTHLYGVLLRGSPLRIVPPSDFSQILQRVWWPLDETLSYDDAYASALLGCAEFARTGTTTFADTYSGPNSIEGVLDRIQRAVDEVGVRGLIAFEATERHSENEGDRGIEENVRFATKVCREKTLAMPLFSVHASFTVSDRLLQKVRELATKLHIPITIHTSEGLGDLHHNFERYGKRTVKRLEDVGFLGPDVILAHCVNLNNDEVEILAAKKCKVAHNPMSNMLNAVGVAAIPELLARGVKVGLGNDGYIFDAFENMRATFLLHRVHSKNPNAIQPYTILEMATIRGAELYGLDEKIGSIDVGKLADIIVIKPSLLPTPLTASTVAGHLINSVDGEDVETVMVNGKVIVDKKRLLTVREEAVETLSQTAAAALWQRLSKHPPQVDVLR